MWHTGTISRRRNSTLWLTLGLVMLAGLVWAGAKSVPFTPQFQGEVDSYSISGKIVTITLKGQVSDPRWGDGTFVATGEIDLSTETGKGSVTINWAAADTLELSVSGFRAGSSLRFVGKYEITSGDGRFEGSHGKGSVKGSFDLGDRSFSGQARGVIKFQ